jgi:hypothetical protein
MHEIRSISTTLEWVLRDSLYLFPYEVKNEELKSIYIGGAMAARMFLLYA